MLLTVEELRNALDGLPGDAKVCMLVTGHGRSVLVEQAANTGYVDLGNEGEFEDSLTGQYLYIISGGQRRGFPYLTEEEQEELADLLD